MSIRIKPAIWDDGRVRHLKDPRSALLLFWLLTNEEVVFPGVAECSLESLTRRMYLDSSIISQSVDDCVSCGLIRNFGVGKLAMNEGLLCVDNLLQYVAFRGNPNRIKKWFWRWQFLPTAGGLKEFCSLELREQLSSKLQCSWDATFGAFLDGTAVPQRRGREGISASLRFAVLKRDKFRCTYCGRSASDAGCTLELDHVQPVSRGGLTKMANLVTACRDCNLGKNSTVLDPEDAA